ncbi:hypothetical protein SJAG_01112 [Schizosaccharomyces japonicus yFS275]|uniref:Palmitoyltransferase n=1 Tax=Schizosaccharomyces japonicus (strain yFS275 / FY16936) TaxID=402676 RepID=B6JZS2_SCHJY|nr:hypothetical protein SJAG_01112 [Schizosaccharomyces japonicus yFS275]EEB06072.2 hypothetical protein SJAG_01112 [Schizosaccharomyces japonicus yFS275]
MSHSHTPSAIISQMRPSTPTLSSSTPTASFSASRCYTPVTPFTNPLHISILENNYHSFTRQLQLNTAIDDNSNPLQATPLHVACKHGNLKIINSLLEHGASPTIKDYQGYSPFHLTVTSGNTLAALLFLPYLPSLDDTDAESHTALMWAAYTRNSTLLATLLKYGANPYPTDDSGLTTLHWALVGGNADCIHLLLTHAPSLAQNLVLGLAPSIQTLTLQPHSLYAFKNASRGTPFYVTHSNDLNPSLINVHRYTTFYYTLSTYVGRAIELLLSPLLCTTTILYFAYCPLILAIILAPITIYFIYTPLTHFLLQHSYKTAITLETPFFASFCSYLLLFALTFLFLILLPKTFTQNKLLGSLTTAFLLFATISYIRTCLQSKTQLPLPERTALKNSINESLDRNCFDTTNFCVSCNTTKFPRTHHCRICNVCVEVFDHHCPWSNSCIGKRNHRTFFLFIFSLSIAIPLFITLSLRYVNLIPTNEKYDNTHCFINLWNLCDYSKKNGVLVAFDAIVIINWLWVLVLLFNQIWSISFGKTTFELRKQRLQYSSRMSQAHSTDRSRLRELANQCVSLVGLDQLQNIRTTFVNATTKQTTSLLSFSAIKKNWTDFLTGR